MPTEIIKIIILAIFYGYCFCVGVQLIFYLVVFRKLAFYKAMPEPASPQDISLIICARDEAHNLAFNLIGILAQEYKGKQEILVVNDNSTDDTKYLLDEYKNKFPQLKTIELSQEAKLIAGKKFPLSIGIKSSQYNLLLLTDADCMPASEFWMEKMQAAYTPTTDIVLGYGAYKKKKGFLNKLIRFETFHTALQYLSYALAGIPYMGVGRNLSYRKSVFLRNKGFATINMIPSGDDDLFINQVAKKNNTAIMIDRDAHTISEPKNTWKEWQYQKQRHFSTAKYYKSSHKFLLGLYATTWFFLYPLLIVSSVFYEVWLPLELWLLRFLIQQIVFYKTMKKLNETDLYSWIMVFDVIMPFVFLTNISALWKKPESNW